VRREVGEGDPPARAFGNCDPGGQEAGDRIVERDLAPLDSVLEQ
jgi:hypothetical protein